MAKGNWNWLRIEIENILGTNPATLARLFGTSRQGLNRWLANESDPRFLYTLLLAYFFSNDSAEELARKAGIDWDVLIKSILERADEEDVKLQFREGAGFTPSLYKLFGLKDVDALGIVLEFFKYNGSFEQLRETAQKLLKETYEAETEIKAQLLFLIAYADMMQGRLVEAVETATYARKQFEHADNPKLLADTYWLSGECARIIGQFNKAQTHLDNAAKIYRDLRTKPTYLETGPIWVQWDLGQLACTYGRYEVALDHFDEMALMARQAGHPEAAIVAMWSRACVEDETGDFLNAHARFIKGSEIAYQVGDKFWEAQSLRKKADVERKQSRYREAIRTAKDASKIYKEVKNNKLPENCNMIIAGCYLHMGRLHDAHNLYFEAAEIYQQANDNPMLGKALSGLALASFGIESKKSNPDFRTGLQSLRNIDESRSSVIDVYDVIYERLAFAEALRLNGFYDQAIKQFNKIVKDCDSYGNRLEKAHALLGIAETNRLTAQADKLSCNLALEIYKDVGSNWGEIHCLISMALSEPIGSQNVQGLLQEALTIANASNLHSYIELINSFANKTRISREQLILFFV